MIRSNEVEDPANAKIENDFEKIYWGPEYRRIGSVYTFGAVRPPNLPVPSKCPPATAGTGNRPLDRLALALNEQKTRLEELEGRLQIFADRTLSNLRLGGPLVRSGEFAQIVAEISERTFILRQIQGALSAMEKEG